MSIKNKFHTLNKKEFDEYLNKLKESEGTLIFLSCFDKSFFYYQSNEIDQLLLSLNKAQWKFDNLINSFSYFAKNQIIQSYLIEEIESTNKIENIYSTKHDIFSIIKEVSSKSNKKLKSITNSYKLLLDENRLNITSLGSIKNTYDSLLLDCIEAKDIYDGKYFRKDVVYINDGSKNVHTGLINEESINLAMEEFIKIYNSNIELYKKMILSHFILEYIHPYYDGNGRLGRFLFSSGIYKESNSLFAFLISTCLLNEKSKYYKAFKVADDPLEFGCLNEYVKIITEILLRQINNEITKLESKKEKINNLVKLSTFSKSENKIYSLLAEAAILTDFGVSNDEIINECNVSKRTLIYTLNKLKELNLLEDTKIGKLTYHKIKQ